MAPPPMMGGRGQRGKPVSKPKDMRAVIKRLFGYMSGDRHSIAAACVCVLVSAVTNLAGSYMLRPLINKCMENIPAAERVAALGAGLLLMGAVYIAGVAATYIQSRLMIKVSQNALQKIRDELFVKMQRLPIRFFDKNATGDLMGRYTNDVDTIGEMLNSTVLQLFSGAMSIVGTLGLMIYINPILTLVTVFMIPLFAKAAGEIAKRSRKFFSAQQKALGAMNGYIEETVTGSKVVKVFCHEEKVQAEFDKLNNEYASAQVKAQFSGGVMGPIMGNLSQINYALTACVGSVLCVLRGFDVGGLTVFVNYSRHFSRPINELSMQVSNIMSALAGAERVFGIMDEEPEPEDAPDSVELTGVRGSVEVRNITFGYDPDKVILKNISFWAKPGQKIAFVGSTGAGKTTIINLLTRFYDIDEGEIIIDGHDIKKIKRESLHKSIAMVLQDTHLFSGTVMENIRYGRLDATDDEVIAAAKTSSAHNFIKHLPNGYYTVLDGDGSNLSQGQRQLLNIARATLSKAPILILDEATSSVDTRTEQEINRGMDSLMENRTTFVIAHRLSTVRNADAIMVMEHGEIIERGTHDELLELKGRYYELYTGMAELD